MSLNPFHAVLFLLIALVARARGSLTAERRGSLRAKLDAGDFAADIQAAIGEALGCGGHVGTDRLAAIEKSLTPLWKVLPKTPTDRIERRMLRYAAHRYFMQTSSVMVRGFEPTRLANGSDWGSADILSLQAPRLVEALLHSQHSLEQGFTFQDVVRVVVILEELVFDSESMLLQKVYDSQFRSTSDALIRADVQLVLEEYLLRWILGGAVENIDDMGAGQLEKFKRMLPAWHDIAFLAHGQLEAMRFEAAAAPAPAAVAATRPQGPGRRIFRETYSFDDLHAVVGGMTKTFSQFWSDECSTMTEQLINLDPRRTGRVPLSKFYGSGHWRFTESESYLRELGALDETSSVKQVLIPNYVQSASNCIVATPHYLVCCRNYCEDLRVEIEAAVGQPVASPAELLAIVGNMTSQASLDEDDPPQLASQLTQRLEGIAAAHGGKVPLHGRLFAQWLHYVFPRACPFPHKAGMAAPVAPAQYGLGYMATDAEMSEHKAAAAANSSSSWEEESEAEEEEQRWMSAWSAEEELLADYGAQLRTPWAMSTEHSLVLLGGGVMLLFIGGFSGILHYGRRGGCHDGGVLPRYSKAHSI